MGFPIDLHGVNLLPYGTPSYARATDGTSFLSRGTKMSIKEKDKSERSLRVYPYRRINCTKIFSAKTYLVWRVNKQTKKQWYTIYITPTQSIPKLYLYLSSLFSPTAPVATQEHYFQVCPWWIWKKNSITFLFRMYSYIQTSITTSQDSDQVSV